MQRVWFAVAALGLAGCFPDYQLESGPPPDMTRMRSSGATVEFDVTADQGQVRSSVTLSYDFDVDEHEVTVDHFNVWWKGERALPPASSSLDEGGIYEDQMRWHASWDAPAQIESFQWANENVDTDQTCSGPKPYPVGGQPSTTWRMAEDGVPGAQDFPMTCVSWMQAAAFCASQGKRLPTAAEWKFVRAEGGTTYPWGGSPPSCDDAIVNANGQGCGFPVPVGTAARDETPSGAVDMVGSVFEWLWEARWPGAVNEQDWAGPGDNESPDREHLRAGGAYISEEWDQRMSGVIEPHYGANQQFNDAGFRCARSVK